MSSEYPPPRIMEWSPNSFYTKLQKMTLAEVWSQMIGGKMIKEAKQMGRRNLHWRICEEIKIIGRIFTAPDVIFTAEGKPFYIDDFLFKVTRGLCRHENSLFPKEWELIPHLDLERHTIADGNFQCVQHPFSKSQMDGRFVVIVEFHFSRSLDFEAEFDDGPSTSWGSLIQRVNDGRPTRSLIEKGLRFFKRLLEAGIKERFGYTIKWHDSAEVTRRLTAEFNAKEEKLLLERENWDPIPNPAELMKQAQFETDENMNCTQPNQAEPLRQKDEPPQNMGPRRYSPPRDPRLENERYRAMLETKKTIEKTYLPAMNMESERPRVTASASELQRISPIQAPRPPIDRLIQIVRNPFPTGHPSPQNVRRTESDNPSRSPPSSIPKRREPSHGHRPIQDPTPLMDPRIREAPILRNLIPAGSPPQHVRRAESDNPQRSPPSSVPRRRESAPSSNPIPTGAPPPSYGHPNVSPRPIQDPTSSIAPLIQAVRRLIPPGSQVSQIQEAPIPRNPIPAGPQIQEAPLNSLGPSIRNLIPCGPPPPQSVQWTASNDPIRSPPPSTPTRRESAPSSNPIPTGAPPPSYGHPNVSPRPIQDPTPLMDPRVQEAPIPRNPIPQSVRRTESDGPNRSIPTRRESASSSNPIGHLNVPPPSIPPGLPPPAYPEILAIPIPTGVPPPTYGPFNTPPPLLIPTGIRVLPTPPKFHFQTPPKSNPMPPGVDDYSMPPPPYNKLEVTPTPTAPPGIAPLRSSDRPRTSRFTTGPPIAFSEPPCQISLEIPSGITTPVASQEPMEIDDVEKRSSRRPSSSHSRHRSSHRSSTTKSRPRGPRHHRRRSRSRSRSRTPDSDDHSDSSKDQSRKLKPRRKRHCKENKPDGFLSIDDTDTETMMMKLQYNCAEEMALDLRDFRNRCHSETSEVPSVSSTIPSPTPSEDRESSTSVQLDVNVMAATRNVEVSNNPRHESRVSFKIRRPKLKTSLVFHKKPSFHRPSREELSRLPESLKFMSRSHPPDTHILFSLNDPKFVRQHLFGKCYDYWKSHGYMELAKEVDRICNEIASNDSIVNSRKLSKRAQTAFTESKDDAIDVEKIVAFVGEIMVDRFCIESNNADFFLMPKKWYLAYFDGCRFKTSSKDIDGVVDYQSYFNTIAEKFGKSEKIAADFAYLRKHISTAIKKMVSDIVRSFFVLKLSDDASAKPRFFYTGELAFSNAL